MHQMVWLLAASSWAILMIDDLIGLAITAAADVGIAKAAKKHCWARILRVFSGLLFFALIVSAIYVTFKYS